MDRGVTTLGDTEGRTKSLKCILKTKDNAKYFETSDTETATFKKTHSKTVCKMDEREETEGQVTN